MELAGTAEFFDELLPDKFIPELLDLILNAWQKVEVFKDPSNKPIEIRVTALLFLQVKRAKAQSPTYLPFTVSYEAQDPDPITGKQLGRQDLCFLAHNRSDSLFFTFEAKPLRCPDANNSEYIKEMQSFISNKKQVAPAHCGMLGYVMDGQVTKAFHSLQASIKKLSVELGMIAGSSFVACYHFLHPPHGQTEHNCPVRGGQLAIHHLLLGVTK